MQTPNLDTINVYPIKSTAAISLSNTWIDELGLSFDRRFVVTDVNGKFITARTQPKLCLIQSSLTAEGLILTAPDMPALTLNYQALSEKYQNVQVWSDTINAREGNKLYDNWFSDYLGLPCHLFYFGEQSQRKVKNRNNSVSFADGYPILLISQASLSDLNERLSNQNQVSMSQFRPNLVVDNCDAFEEDTWQHIRIGEVEFEVAKPCSRCVFTTVNPESGEYHPQQEPLQTLKKYRQVSDGDVMFGQNLIALNKGQIKAGDKVVVLKRQAALEFSQSVTKKAESNNIETSQSTANDSQAMLDSKNSKVSLTFDSWNKTITANTKQSILDQGEDAGLLMPFSCRAGMCGRCKVKLNHGEVKQLANDGLTDEEKEQGYILACSSIPQSDISVSRARRK